MSQAAPQKLRKARKEVQIGASTLTVSAYDRVASMMIALLVLVGAAVFCLFVGWLSSGIFHYERAVPVVMEELASGGGYENGVGTEGQHIEAPTESDIAAESDILEDAPTDTLSAVVDAAATGEGVLDRFDMQFARGEGVRTGGRSEGTGNHPAKGTGGGFGGGAARRTDWEIRFPPGNTVETYAKQLEFFGIELGVFGAANDITYINKLTQPKPSTRTGPRAAESRKYMTWSRGDLDQADKELLRMAGIQNLEGRMVFKFLPPAIETQLTTLERQFKNRPAKD
ncbi:MAG: hypothetical protein ABUL64_02875, partial [Singulisphaera sp.]